MKVSVSNLLKELATPYLIGWANNLGLDGIRLKDFYKKSTGDGINKHLEFQEDVKKNGYKDYNLKYIEYDLNNNRIIGRCDIIFEKDGIDYIFDLKSNNKIYLSHKLQLVAYKLLYGNCKIGIIDLNNKKETILNITEEEEDCYIKILKGLYYIYINKKKIGE